jgi:aspartokinase
MKIGGMLENNGLTMYRVTTVRDEPGAAGAILKFYAQRNINLEYITESGGADGRAIISVCIKDENTKEVDRFIAENKEALKPYIIEKFENLSTLSIYGPHFREKHSIAARYCRLLGAFGVNILGLSSSISSICAIIRTCQIEQGKKAVLKKFEMP